MAKKITVKLYIGNQEIETLTEEHRKKIAERLSKEMSLYYTNNPNEYEKVCNGNYMLGKSKCNLVVEYDNGQNES